MDTAKTCLLIDAAKLERLSLDGPALRVQMQAQSGRLFPLRRIARIHVMGQGVVSMDALLHCAEQRIPVAFFRGNGKLRCQLYFPGAEDGTLGHWLVYLDFDTCVRDVYEHWLQDQRLHVMAALGIRSGCPEHRLKMIREQISTVGNRSLGKLRFREALDWLHGFLQAQLSQLIAEQGLSLRDRHACRLLGDIQSLCELSVDMALCRQLSSCGKGKLGSARLSRLYQDQADSIAYNVRHMLASLTSRLENII